MVSISCRNNNDVARAKSVLSEKLGGDFSVELEHLRLPKVKVINVDNDLNKEDLQDDIHNRNFLDFDGAFSIIADYKNAMGKRTLILEVNSESYMHLSKNSFRIYIGHQCCRVFDYFNINICNKCGRLNHNHSRCNNPAKCLICAGDHHAKACKSQVKKCLNCVFYNEKYQRNRPSDHCASDTRCPYLAYKFSSLIKNTDYPIKPAIPISIGKVDANASGNRGKLIIDGR
jgi:hypothetical protein